VENSCVEGSVEHLKFVGLDSDTDICMFSKISIEGATKDPHYLLNCIQLSRTQANITEVTANIDGTMTTLKVNRSYCSDAKICAGDVLYP